jgi:hypothetical protein
MQDGLHPRLRWALIGSVDHGANASGGRRVLALYRKDEAATAMSTSLVNSNDQGPATRTTCFSVRAVLGHPAVVVGVRRSYRKVRVPGISELCDVVEVKAAAAKPRLRSQPARDRVEPWLYRTPRAKPRRGSGSSMRLRWRPPAVRTQRRRRRCGLKTLLGSRGQRTTPTAEACQTDRTKACDPGPIVTPDRAPACEDAPGSSATEWRWPLAPSRIGILGHRGHPPLAARAAASWRAHLRE